jgi:hypothetical protein
VSICLVRTHDGIIYNTGYHYTYHSQNPQASIINSKQNIESKILNTRILNCNKDNRDSNNSTIYVPRPSLKRHSMSYD